MNSMANVIAMTSNKTNAISDQQNYASYVLNQNYAKSQSARINHRLQFNANPELTANFSRTLTGHDERVQCVAFSPDSKIFISAGHDSRVLMWNRSSNIAKLVLYSFLNNPFVQLSYLIFLHLIGCFLNLLTSDIVKLLHVFPPIFRTYTILSCQ